VGCIAATFAAMLAAALASGTPAIGFVHAWFAGLGGGEAAAVLGRSALAGGLVALACYHLGVGPKRSSADVGAAVDRAIVAAMALVLGVHAVGTFVAYA
jgi:ABC-type transporter Mla maintaining outer membrane lipid asymmetry permease subunit MlaE